MEIICFLYYLSFQEIFIYLKLFFFNKFDSSCIFKNQFLHNIQVFWSKQFFAFLKNVHIMVKALKFSLGLPLWFRLSIQVIRKSGSYKVYNSLVSIFVKQRTNIHFLKFSYFPIITLIWIWLFSWVKLEVYYC
jgi:hypothetical protein